MPEKSDRCHVCGREGPLSFEHIPPRSMGNNQGARSYRGVDIIKRAGVFGASAKDGVRFTKMRRGIGVQALCGSCNSYFGTHYVREYTGCMRELGAHFVQHPPADDAPSIHLSGGNVNVLAFFKHVVSNFCSTTPYGTMLDCREFLLDKESNDFPSRYRLYMFAVPDSDSVMITTGWMVLYYANGGSVTLAHVATFPVGFTLVDVDASDFIPPYLGCDITPMASRKWGDCPEFALDLPLMTLDKMLPVPRAGKEGARERNEGGPACA